MGFEGYHPGTGGHRPILNLPKCTTMMTRMSEYPHHSLMPENRTLQCPH